MRGSGKKKKEEANRRGQLTRIFLKEKKISAFRRCKTREIPISGIRAKS